MPPRMAPAVSAATRQIMTAAFEDLERTVTATDALDMRSVTTIQQVRAAALVIEKQLAARQTLRNMRRLAPLFSGLEHYAKVIDVLCNGTPLLSWIWSPLTLILRVASEYIEAFERIIKGYSRIGDALGRFERLGNVFVTNPDFQYTLAVFYANILQFHKHAYNFVRRSGWRLLFITSWGRFQRRFDNILESLDRHGDLVDREANAYNIAEARQQRQLIYTWREESLEQVKRDEDIEAAKQYGSILSGLKIDETEQIAIFESTSTEGSKFPGTCEWVSKNEKFRSWLQRGSDETDAKSLWLQGKPGSGKSVLCTQLVNFLHASKLPVIHHFCNDTYASSTKYDAILKTLLHQLLRSSGDLAAYTFQEYIVGKKSPTTSNLEQLLETLLAGLSKAGQTKYIWIIVDGIEECEETKQAQLVTFMNHITSKLVVQGSTICKVLLTSRAYPARFKRFWRKNTISLSDETEQLSKAIQLYAAQRLRALRERFQQLELDNNDVETIECMVAKKADGMFLYARLVLDYLSKNIFYSGDELKQSIDQLPETIAEFYQNIMARMLAPLDPRSLDRVRCMLSWIAFARRPLKRLELLSALTFTSGNENTSNLVPRYMLDICSPLVEEKRDSTFTFIHVSVKEFLQSESGVIVINEQDAIQEHGLATVTCLLSAIQVFDDRYPEQGRLLRLIKGFHALHVYSTEYWTEYLLAYAKTVNKLDPSSAFFTKASSLAEALDEMQSGSLVQCALFSSVTDNRLALLTRYPSLKRHVEKALMARSPERLESEILQEPAVNSIKTLPKKDLLDGISVILNAYQRSIETILDRDSCVGALTEELELFKSQFRTSAYTCRLRTCPRATVGFDSEQLRHEHEIGHIGGFRFPFPSCHYPPFRTAQSLKSHIGKCHTASPPQRPIRNDGPSQPMNPLKNSATALTGAHYSVSTSAGVRGDSKFSQGEKLKQDNAAPSANVTSEAKHSWSKSPCHQCKRAKKKCNRLMPQCERCIKVGLGLCSYFTGVSRTEIPNEVPSETAIDTNNVLTSETKQPNTSHLMKETTTRERDGIRINFDFEKFLNNPGRNLTREIIDTINTEPQHQAGVLDTTEDHAHASGDIDSPDFFDRLKLHDPDRFYELKNGMQKWISGGLDRTALTDLAGRLFPTEPKLISALCSFLDSMASNRAKRPNEKADTSHSIWGPRYCICDGASSESMISCNKDSCPRQWFHFQCGCFGLGTGTWGCRKCLPKERPDALEEMIHEKTVECMCEELGPNRGIILCGECAQFQHVACYYSVLPGIHQCIDCCPRPVDRKHVAKIILQRQEQNTGIYEEGRLQFTTKIYKEKARDHPSNQRPKPTHFSRFDDPKEIASALSMPSPTSKDFPSLSEIHAKLPSNGIAVKELVNIFKHRIKQGDHSLLIHMFRLVARFDLKQKNVIPMPQIPSHGDLGAHLEKLRKRLIEKGGNMMEDTREFSVQEQAQKRLKTDDF